MNSELVELENWIDELKDCEKTIVVEGKKDFLALKSLGIDNNIISINKPLFKVVDDIIANKNKNNKKVVILTDLDKKGRQLYGKLKKDFCRNGYKIDAYFREFLQKNTKLRQIEGLPKYLERLK